MVPAFSLLTSRERTLILFLKLLLLFTLFFIPLIGPQFNLGYEGAKVLIFYILSIVAGVVWLVCSFLYPKELYLKHTAILGWAALFLLALFITGFTGVNFHNSFFGEYPYYQGFFLYAFLFLFYLEIRSLKLSHQFFLPAMLLSSVFVSFFALRDWVTLHLLNQYVPTYAGRVVSSFGQPNFYAGFLLITLPFSFSLLDHPHKKVKIFNLLVMLLSILAIIASESRAAILLLIGYILFLFSHRMTMKLKLILGLGIILFFLLFASISPMQVFNQEIEQPNDLGWLNKNSPEKRTLFWPVVSQVILQNPILGFGLENLDSAYRNFFVGKQQLSAQELSLKDLVIKRSHNYILDLLTFSGVVGLITWGGLIWQLFRKKQTPIIFASFVLYLIWVQIQNQSLVQLMYFWLLVGLVDGSHLATQTVHEK